MPLKRKPKIERVKDLIDVMGSDNFLKSLSSKLICGGISYFIGFLTGQLSLILTLPTDYVVNKLIKNSKLLESKFVEIVLGKHPDGKYENVGSFWTRIEKEGLEEGAIVEISGLLSPYAPLFPSHPMSRPGYTIEGWESFETLETESTEEYDVRDSLIYGDRVVRLSQSKNGKYYAGLYNHDYGISNISLPLLIDEKIVRAKKNGLMDLWKDRFTKGRFVRIKGNLIKIPNFYSTFTSQIPEEYINLPSYALEVGEIKDSYEPKGVTHIAISVSWESKEKEEQMLTHYFNVQDLDQQKLAEDLLDQAREKHKIIFDYDDLMMRERMSKKMPELNELLRDWLE